MDQLANVNNYMDLAGLQQLKTKAKTDPNDNEALKKAAEHFESIFIGMMLKSMRKANEVFEEGNPMHSNTTRFFRDMYDQPLATDMASKGSLGLADIIVQQLNPNSESYTAADLMRNDGEFKRHQFNNSLEQQDTPAHSSLSLSSQLKDLVNKPFSEAGMLVSQVQASNAGKANKAETNFESPEDFVEKIWRYAKKAATEIGLNPAVMVAQSALETGWGKHIIKDKNGESSFNLFNVKAHRDWQGEKAAQSTLEFENGVAVRKVEPFRVYGGFEESFNDLVSFLRSNSRYQGALSTTNNSEQFLHNLQKAGYATDPNYADKIMGILNSDNFKSIIGRFSQSVDNQ